MERIGIQFATSANLLYFQKYGRKMAETFLKFVHCRASLRVYHEASEEATTIDAYRVNLSPSRRISFWDLYRETGIRPFLTEAAFYVFGKLKGLPLPDPDARLARPGYNYQWDAVTFAKKAFAIIHAARTSTARFFFWVDADTTFRKYIPEEVLQALFKPDADIVCFKRAHPHTETGFFGLDLASPRTRSFVESYARIYEERKLFENEAGWTDCHAFDMAILATDGLRVKNLSTKDEGHVVAASPLGEYIDHMKGSRKQAGASPERKG